MFSIKDSLGRRATDNAQGVKTDRHNQESGDSDISEGRTPHKVKSGMVRHDHKGNAIWEWATRFQRRRADDLPVHVNTLVGEDLTLAEYEKSSKTETIDPDTLEATARMKAPSFDNTSWMRRVQNWVRND